MRTHTLPAAPQSGETHPAPTPHGARQAAQTSPRELRLILSARRGDRRAEEIVLRSYERVIAVVSSEFRACWFDDADLRQIARVALWRAIREWDPGRAPFAQFVRITVRSDLADAIKAAARKKHQVVTAADSLQRVVGVKASDAVGGTQLAEVLSSAAHGGSDPFEVAAVRESLAEILEQLPLLSDRERASVAMVADGYSRGEVAAELGGNAKSIDNALKRGRTKLAERAA